MASIKKFYSRSELGMRSPRSTSSNITPQNGGVAVHYGGAAQKISSQKAARERWLAWQRFHMAPGGLGTSNGAADIAYTAGFDNWGNVYAGRGYGVRTAAQGTNAGNQNYLAFVWLGGGNEKPSKSALEALNWLIEDARKNGNAGNAVKPHSFFRSTACPGGAWRSRAAELDGKSTLPPVEVEEEESEPTPPPASRDYITVGDKGTEVRSWQQDLQKWNSSALPRFGADGDFGAETAEWTVRFYDVAGLTASDRSAPRVGDNSREAMKKVLAAAEAARKEEEASASRNYITVGDKGSEVRSWQNKLRQWNSSALPRFGADGDFGSETAEWSTRFLRSVGVSVADPSRPRIGPVSLSAMEKALAATSSFKFSHTTLIRRGSRGAAVKEWQEALRRWRPSALPRFGADGDFGNETHDWTRRFQSASGIVVDGVVGPQTRRTMTRRLN